jgi:hypothetical protein
MGKYKENYEFNCQELNRVTMELVEAKCELDVFKEENLKLKKELEYKNSKIGRLESIINIYKGSLKIAIESIRGK